MSNYFYNAHQQHIQNPHPMMSSSNHHGRSRRNQRMSSTQPNRQYRQQQQHLHHHAQHQQQHQQQQPQMLQQKQIEKAISSEAPALIAFRARFEAGRSFDLDDDMEFCPQLLSWDERQSITSGSSDRSSLSSGSPEQSPMQHQITPALSLSSTSTAPYVSPTSALTSNNHLKIHQPSAIRSRNPIPIVNPDTRTRMSPPSSISPSMMAQAPRW